MNSTETMAETCSHNISIVTFLRGKNEEIQILVDEKSTAIKHRLP